VWRDVCRCGAGVARGYLNRSELTAERFISDPFGNKIDARLYRTGDLAKYRPDGSLEFLGRIDDQVKIRGFRIELGEIEAALSEHPNVQQVVVVVHSEQSDDKRLVAYIVSKREGVSVNALRQYLQERLPEYMVPSLFMLLEEMPLTENGKVNRKALPAPRIIRTEVQFVAPRNLEEELLAQIWSEVLKVEQVGIHDNFFELGGDSLLSIQVVTKSKKGGLELSPQHLFKYKTIHNIVRVLGQLNQSELSLSISETAPLSLISQEECQSLPNGVEDAYPLTRLQLGMLFHSEYTPETAVYHDVMSYHLKAPLDIPILHSAIKEVVDRHPVLRTSVAVNQFSQPLQLVHSQVTVDLSVDDLSSLPSDEQEEAIANWTEQEKKQPFHWETAPLARFHVHRRSSDTFSLTFSCHHLILDGWSVATLMTELLQQYFFLLGKTVSSLATVPNLTFRDYIAFEQEVLKSQACQRYWHEKLADFTVTKLPRLLDTQQYNPTGQARTQNIEISSDLAFKLRKFATEIGVPLKSVLLAAHLRVMSFLSNQTDIITGMTTHGRPAAEGSERVLGLFLNTTPIRMRMDGGTWIELVEQVFEQERENLPFQQYPLAQLQQEVGLGQPLFETTFNYTNFHVYQNLSDIDELEYLGGEFFDQTNFTFGCQFFVNPITNDMFPRLDYDPSQLSFEQVSNISGYYVAVLEAMVTQSEERYEQVCILSEVERHKFLYEWNNTAANYPSDLCIHQLFEQQVERLPEAIAVIFEDQKLTYQELNQRANQLANHLKSLGVGPDVPVGIFLERSLGMVVGVLGVLKAGGAYVPLDPGYPQERLVFMLEDSQAPVLLIQQSLLQKISKYKGEVINLDGNYEIFSQQSSENLATEITSKNLVYIIYTSGSTGTPKGVMIEHQGVVNYLSWCINSYEVANLGGAPVNSSLSFDATVTALFSPLLTGRTVFLLPEKEPIEHLVTWLSTHEQMSLIKITPAHLDILSHSLPEKNLTTASTFVIGGEALQGPTLALWKNRPVGSRFINEYGPTETVVGCCVYEVSVTDNLIGSVPIGRPIANTQMYILDQQQKLVPIGVTGEIYIGGAGVARGYLNRPELTQEKFIVDPFNPGGRLYRTGDLGRYCQDGNLEYLGRIDNQVKLRGFRIELGEIEAALSEHPNIQQVVVVMQEESIAHKKIVAYVVTKETGKETSSNDLRQYLKEKLPAYMVPSIFMLIEEMPLTPNGKIDRKALPNPDITRSDVQVVAPNNPTEELLAKLWKQVLCLEQVSIHDNFFEVGGDSILSMQIVARAHQEGLYLSAKQMFQHQTIAELATVANANPPAQAQQGLLSGEVLLSPIQKWYFEQPLQQIHHFNQTVLLGVPANIHVELLPQVLSLLLEHHDALRLRFTNVDGEWKQEYANPPIPEALPWGVIDLSTLSQEHRSKALTAAAEEVQQNLNLQEGPIIQCVLFQMGPEQSARLFLAVHHLAVDGVSWRILLEDFANIYAQLQRGQTPQLPAKSSAVQQWVKHLNDYAQNDLAQSEKTFWLNQNYQQAQRLPLDFAEQPDSNCVADEVSVTHLLSIEQTQVLLQQVPAAYNTQVNDILLASLLLAYSRWSGTNDLLLDLEGHGREELFEQIDLSRTVGWFTSIYPVVLHKPIDDDLGKLVKSVKEQLRSIPKKGIGYGILRYLSEDEQTRKHLRELPTPQIGFNYLGQVDASLEPNGLFSIAHESTGQEVGLGRQRVHMLEMNALTIGGQLHLQWSYSQRLHKQVTVERLGRMYLDALEELIAHCILPESGGYTPSDFSSSELSQQELDQLLSQLDS
jgi:amino acid adenylation domain-containing protein/non-ribosomal peptide synthase protein (TIGR01720 family)